jgi:hypothetical protein
MRKNKKEPTVICKTCGHENEISLERCSVCDADLTEVKEEVEYIAPPNIINKPKVILLIFSFMLPFLGLILFIVKRKKEPKAAKAYLKCFIINIVMSLVLSVVAFALTTKFAINLGESLPINKSEEVETVPVENFEMYDGDSSLYYDVDYYVPPVE